MLQKFYVCMLRFFYRRIRMTSHKPPTSLPGHRDPDSVCHGYTPVSRRAPVGQGWISGPNGGAVCAGDGHYLCHDCAYFDWSSNGYCPNCHVELTSEEPPVEKPWPMVYKCPKCQFTKSEGDCF